MGMCTPIPMKEPSLIAANLVICKSCKAQCNPTCEWVRGKYKGTSMDFTVAMTVPEDCCPVCLKPQKERLII